MVLKRKGMVKRAVSLGVASLLFATALAACGNSGDEGTDNGTQTTAGEGTGDADETDDPGEDAVYPLPGGELTVWLDLNSNVAANYTSLGETPYAEEYERLTGVTITYMHPPAGQSQEQLTLMIPTGDYPDIVEYNWLNAYSGGPQKAIEDNFLIELNDIIEQYAPDYKAYLDANEDIAKQVVTDDGSHYVFPFVRESDAMAASLGPMMRGDWLEELNLDMPTTLQELEDILIAFRDEMGASAPYSFEHHSNDMVMFSHGTSNSFQFDDDGNIVYGAITDEYRNYLETMNRWYAEGLLDADYATIDRAQLDSKITTGQTGFTVAWVGSGMGVWNLAGQQNNPDFELVPINYVSEDGSKSEYGYLEFRYGGGGSAGITTSAEDVELAARWLNFGYTDAGYAANNFGIEGESFTVEDGEFTYTDQVMNHPDGWPLGQSMGAYVRAVYSGQFIQSLRYQDQYFTTESQRQAPVMWSDTNIANHRLPNRTPTAAESSELATILNDIQTYRDEMTLRFILGTEPLENWDTYVTQIRNSGLDRAIEIQEAAVERFNNR